MTFPNVTSSRRSKRQCWAPLVAVRIALKSSVSVLRAMESDFYLRYYVGHKGKFGHEFLEFEFRPDGERSLPAPRERGLGLGAGEWGGRGSVMYELEEGTILVRPTDSFCPCAGASV